MFNFEDAINAVLVDGTVHDSVARLWAQAERIRAYLPTAEAATRSLALSGHYDAFW
jgi:mannose/cellobiose epimerase-like protein (N-acyl-D-glucosamine 2-epimerase family)